MPKGKRITGTHKGVKYNFSEAQYTMLSKDAIRSGDAAQWAFEARVRGLASKGLIVKRKGSYKRTNLGAAVYNTIADRVKKVAAKGAAKE